MSYANVGRNVRWRLRGKSPFPLTAMAMKPNPTNPPAMEEDPSHGNALGRVCHYAAFKIRRTGSAEQIRQAYRKRAVQLHPDKLASRFGRLPTASEVVIAERDDCRIVIAFYILSDEELRREYDALCGHVGVESQTPCPQTAPIDPVNNARQEARFVI